MKKLKVGVAALIALMAVATAACSGKENANEGGNNDSTATAARTVLNPGESFEPTTNIRFYNADSLAGNYKLLKDFEEANRAMMTQYQQTINARQNELQNLYNKMQQKQQTGAYLSQASMEADARELQQKDQAFQQLQMSIDQKVQLETMRQQAVFFDSIHNFLANYNREKHYDAIMPATAGVYYNPALDITQEMIQGMNAAYKGSGAAPADTTKKK